MNAAYTLTGPPCQFTAQARILVPECKSLIYLTCSKIVGVFFAKHQDGPASPCEFFDIACKIPLGRRLQHLHGVQRRKGFTLDFIKALSTRIDGPVFN
jgi:hypothetical protein